VTARSRTSTRTRTGIDRVHVFGFGFTFVSDLYDECMRMADGRGTGDYTTCRNCIYWVLLSPPNGVVGSRPPVQGVVSKAWYGIKTSLHAASPGL
jgi:hypothetical protein